MDKKAYEAVVGFIKSEILSGRLKPGQKLPPEREMAQQLGVSRTSIREALRTMEVLGVIESVQGAGNFISVNFEKNMTEALSMMFLLKQTDGGQLSDIRAALELKAAELAVNRITGREIEELEKIVVKMASANDEKTAADLDRILHYTVARASGNSILIQILSSMSVLIDDFIKDIRTSILKDQKNRDRLIKIHMDIVDALKSADVGAVREAFSQHGRIIEEYLG